MGINGTTSFGLGFHFGPKGRCFCLQRETQGVFRVRRRRPQNFLIKLTEEEGSIFKGYRETSSSPSCVATCKFLSDFSRC